jgi:hypothetical protein
MRSSTLAALLLIVMFMGLALIIVMFGVVPSFSNLMGGPTPQPVVATMPPRPTAAEIAPQSRPLFSTATALPKVTATPTLTPEPTTSAKADALARVALQRDATQAQYRFTTLGIYGMAAAGSDTNVVSLRIDGEVDGNDSWQIVTFDDQTGDKQLSRLEMRVVAGVSYVYANQQWRQETADQSDAQQQFFQTPMDFSDPSVQLTYIATERLADAPVPVYKYHFTVAPGQVPVVDLPPEAQAAALSGMESQQDGYLWIGTDERRYRMEYHMRLYTPQSGLMLGWDLTTRYFDYDDPSIHIEAPTGAVPLGQ